MSPRRHAAVLGPGSLALSVIAAGALLLSGCGQAVGGGPTPVPPSRPASPSPASVPNTSSSSAGSPASSVSPGASPSAPPSASPAGSPEPVDLSRFYEQKVAWTSCGSAQCATIKAPLDYSDPEGPTISLSMARVKATGDKIGTLFVDPGGPGGSAVDYALAADGIVSPQVRRYFDIVGIDPRGVARSSPVECLTDKQLDDLGAADGTPDTPAEEQEVLALSAIPGQGCAKKSGRILAHVGTVDSARDLDLGRALVGDQTLSYLGKSYGTMLGATYAELFPDRVGRMVLDGVLPASVDLVEATRVQSEGFEVAIRDFMAYCLTSSDCPFSGTPDQAVGQFQDWLAALDADPLPGRGQEKRDLNEPLAAYAVLANLYFPGGDYPRLRSALSAAIDRKDPTELFRILDDRISRTPDGHYYDNSTEAFYAVTCLDRPFEGTVDDVRRLAQEWKATAPTFGPALAWGLLTCKDWPASGDRITSTVAKGSNPILVVSTRKDPATPYQWGPLVAGQLDNAVLVTYEGVGHTAYGRGSSCVDDAVDRYLIEGTVPKKDPDCS